MDVNIVQKMYALIGESTPLTTDCGALCGAACCRPDEDGQGGMYLFPGEEALFPGAGGDFAPVYDCGGRCERAHRPMGCRIFPLTPVLAASGWTVRIDRRARAMCPLAASGLRGLDPAFVRAVARAIRLFAAEPGGRCVSQAVAGAGGRIPRVAAVTRACRLAICVVYCCG